MHRSKQHLYSIISPARVLAVACTYRSAERAQARFVCYLSARSLPSRPASVEFRRDRDVGMAEDILHDAQIARLA